MASNIVATIGAAKETRVTNVASTKTSGKLISYPAGGPGAGVKCALLKVDAAANATDVPAFIGGVAFTYACVTTDTTQPGTILYFDIGNDRLTTTASTHNRAGVAYNTKGSGPATVECILGE